MARTARKSPRDPIKNVWYTHKSVPEPVFFINVSQVLPPNMPELVHGVFPQETLGLVLEGILSSGGVPVHTALVDQMCRTPGGYTSVS